MSIPVSIVGHAHIRRVLEQELPPVTLLRGPQSIGKWTLAQHLADHHQVHWLSRYVLDGGLSADAARDLVRWSRYAPLGPFKLALINLDGATRPALDILLKTLEEPPCGVRFLATASQAVPDTLASRCRVYTLTALSVQELFEVLRATHGLSKPVAERQARVGLGRVVAVRASDAAHATVTALVQALARKDSGLFDAVIAECDAATRELMHRWLVEALSGQRLLFTDADMHGLHGDRRRLFQMAHRLSMAPAASARLQLRVALEPFLAT